jgi:heat shock protein HslJ
MRKLSTVLLIAIVVAACSAAGPRTGSPGPSNGGSGIGNPGGDADPSGSWVLEAGTGPSGAIQIVDGHRITLNIEGDQVGGISACNHYGGTIAIAGDALRISAMSMTEMACADDGAMEAEAAYLAALATVTRWARAGDTLTLGGPQAMLTFTLLPPVADEEIVGTSWVLQSLILGDAVSSVLGEEATLQLRADGTLSGGTGCRTFEGRYTMTGDEIVFTQLITTDQGCAADVAGQDEHVLNVLGDGVTATVAGPTLTLISDRNLGLGYRASTAE